MRWIITTLLAVTVALSFGFAAATSLGVTSDNLGSGSATIASCDADGVHVSYDVTLDTPAHIESATVSGIDFGCMGQTLVFSVADFAGQLLYTTDFIVSDATMPIVFPTPIPAPSSVAPAQVTVTITGPIIF